MSQIRNVSNTKCLAVDPVNQVLRKTFPENFSEKVFQNSIIGRGGKSAVGYNSGPNGERRVGQTEAAQVDISIG